MMNYIWKLKQSTKKACKKKTIFYNYNATWIIINESIFENMVICGKGFAADKQTNKQQQMKIVYFWVGWLYD